ncbi:uncharacterized protein PHACADRAFT_254155 [Phanerochaete carnosa HHB-10118-sp]|uniref:Phosphatidate cytidylyltransferase n=1 Tax=Phanerochaete carnosa (strain HHB-10118-sp) TaxID=650164 RepID=K5V2R4_PHACS|nr:uncharacterized protein PHACADRAFT_254155 [Phanerochaete carnosa HHB-10118-sp]EKM56821.1 hypothetical protein PHACADRAFT_254155 [Phanerochaete carnosa HHB-10118-sp]
MSTHTRISPQTYYIPPRKTVKSRHSMNNGHANGHAQHKTSQIPVAQEASREESSRKASAALSTANIRLPHTSPVDWEIPRKFLHSSIGFLTLYLYLAHGSSRTVVKALGMALTIIVPADVLRLSFPGFERIYEKALGFLMRDSEKKTTNGVIWYIIGVLWVLSAYPLDIAVVSILILSWADTAASTIGRAWGRFTPPLPRRLFGLPLAPRKSLAGFIAGSITGAAIVAGFWTFLGPLGELEPVWTFEGGVEGTGSFSGWFGLSAISVVSGLVSGVSEALDLGSLDDNLTLPILSGGCIWGLFKCLKYLA